MAEIWDLIVDKFNAKLDRWRSLLLLKERRLTLAQSVLNSLPVYYFSLLKLPCRVINTMEKLVRDFGWNGEHYRNDSNLVDWSTTSLLFPSVMEALN